MFQRDRLLLGLQVSRNLKLFVVFELRFTDSSFFLKHDSKRSVKRRKSGVETLYILKHVLSAGKVSQTDLSVR